MLIGTLVSFQNPNRPFGGLTTFRQQPGCWNACRWCCRLSTFIRGESLISFIKPATDVILIEEPGQARRISRAGSVISVNLGLNLDDFNDKVGGSGESQRNSLFPWDNAGPSSGSGLAAGDHYIESVNVKLRSESSNSRRESPLAPRQRGSVVGSSTFSPLIGRAGSIEGEDFVFDSEFHWSMRHSTLNRLHLVENPVLEDSQQETQKSDMNLATLERNSHNFLE
jgi:hypothetical protein